MSHPSHCSQHQGGFMFREHQRQPIILNAWFQLWNVEVNLWWFRQQYLGNLLVLKFKWLNYCQQNCQT